MEKLINYENLQCFAYSGDRLCKAPIRGIVVDFRGLGCDDMLETAPPEALLLAEQGIIYLYPYNNPWAWMNRQAIAMTDELIDVLISHYRLPDDIPIVSVGGSMGGLSALVYMVYAKRTPIACVANCPVCDLPYHYTERPDLPSTLYSAFYEFDGTLGEALRSVSPLHLIDRLPDVPYTIFHCEKDSAVNKAMHSDRFVEAARSRLDIRYIPVPDRDHCDLPPEYRSDYWNCCIKAIDTRYNRKN